MDQFLRALGVLYFSRSSWLDNKYFSIRRVDERWKNSKTMVRNGLYLAGI